MSSLYENRRVESETLSTFKKHRPSEYFSHLGDDDSFQAHHNRVELLYRYGLTFPPEYFAGRSVIDLGAGTGENTVSLAKWGALCTLVEINPEAIEVAKEVYRTHLLNHSRHTFINTSLFDLDVDSLKGSFDISHSRGVFTHVRDKRKAFGILASLARPGGYVVYGDRNTFGGIQEMLQRFAIYRLGGNDDERIVQVAEALFYDDIDRSQRAIPRTRKAIIFDRWVIQQQDDPSVDEVLRFFEEEGLEYVSSWPRIDFAGRGTSTHSDPRNHDDIRLGAQLVETLWMMLNNGQRENILSCDVLVESGSFYERLSSLGSLLRNFQISSSLTAEALISEIEDLDKILRPSNTGLASRLSIFFEEVSDFVKLVNEQREPVKIREKIEQYRILFKGYAGVRHVDYIAYKPVR